MDVTHSWFILVVFCYETVSIGWNDDKVDFNRVVHGEEVITFVS